MGDDSSSGNTAARKAADAVLHPDEEWERIAVLAGLSGVNEAGLRALRIITDPANVVNADAANYGWGREVLTSRTDIYDRLNRTVSGDDLMFILRGALRACETYRRRAVAANPSQDPVFWRSLCSDGGGIGSEFVTLIATYPTTRLPQEAVAGARNASHVSLSYLDPDIEPLEPADLPRILFWVAFWLGQWESLHEQARYLGLTTQPLTWP